MRLFLWEKPAGAARPTPRHDPVRARLLDGLAPHLRPAGAGPPELLGDGLLRRAWATTRGASTWRATGARTRRGHQLRHRQRRRRPRGGDRLHHATRGVEAFLIYGISSGALRAALFAQRHPERVARLALDAFVWTGEGSPTLAERRKRLPEFRAKNRRPIDRAFVRSIFTRDHPGTRRRRRDRGVRRRHPRARRLGADRHLRGHVREPAGGGSRPDHGADDHHARPVRRHRRRSTTSSSSSAAAESRQAVRGMPGIAHASFHQKNFRIAYHILHAFFTQPAPIYRGA